MKKLKIDTFRTASASALACIVMGIMLRLQTHAVQEILAKLKDKGKLENVEWLVEYAAYFLPVVLVAVALSIFYSIFKDEKIIVHKEQVIVSIALIAFTYAILLPIASYNKEPVGESEKTMLELSVNWFAFQIVPFLIMLLYHSSMTEEDNLEAEECDKPQGNDAQEKE